MEPEAFYREKRLPMRLQEFTVTELGWAGIMQPIDFESQLFDYDLNLGDGTGVKGECKPIKRDKDGCVIMEVISSETYTPTRPIVPKHEA